MKTKLFPTRDLTELNPEELVIQLQNRIARVDEGFQKLQEREAWGFERYENAASNLIDFWFEYRDQIGFFVWTGDKSTKTDVITATPVDEKETKNVI